MTIGLDVQPPPGPLAKRRIIDFSTSYAGPTAAMYLADLGADVVKVEHPAGEDSRHWGPPFVGVDSAWFVSANRGKRSLCLDVRTPEGYAALMRLLEDADALIVSVNPAKLAQLGLEPSEIETRFPRLVYCLLSGFGLSGDDSELPGYDLIAQARSGLMSVTGAADGPPQRMSTALTDVMAGTVAAMAIAAALHGREQTGRGRVVDVSLLDSALALMAPRIASFAAGESEPRPSGATDSVLAVYQSFPSADRPVVVAVGNDRMWRRFCMAIGREDLAVDPTTRTNAGRRSKRSALTAEIGDTLRQRPSAVILEQLQTAGIPCAPVQFLSDVLADPHVRSRGSIRPIADDTGVGLAIVDQPWRFTDTPRPDVLPPAPRRGQHSVELLREARYSQAEIDDLIERGVLWAELTPTS